MSLWSRRKKRPQGEMELTVRVGGYERPPREADDPVVDEAPADRSPADGSPADVPFLRYADGDVPLPPRPRHSTLTGAFGAPAAGGGAGALWSTPPGYAEAAGVRTDPADLRRFFIIGVLGLVLTMLVLRLLGRTPVAGPSGEPFVPFVFAHYLVTVLVAKLVTDTLYFGLNPRRREWRHLDDYLANDLLTFARFAFPLVVLQAYAYTQAWIPYSLLGLWLGPWAALLLVLANRWLVERAQDQRARARGAVPTIRGRDDG